MSTNPARPAGSTSVVAPVAASSRSPSVIGGGEPRGVGFEQHAGERRDEPARPRSPTNSPSASDGEETGPRFDATTSGDSNAVTCGFRAIISCYRVYRGLPNRAAAVSPGAAERWRTVRTDAPTATPSRPAIACAARRRAKSIDCPDAARVPVVQRCRARDVGRHPHLRVRAGRHAGGRVRLDSVSRAVGRACPGGGVARRPVPARAGAARGLRRAGGDHRGGRRRARSPGRRRGSSTRSPWLRASRTRPGGRTITRSCRRSRTPRRRSPRATRCRRSWKESGTPSAGSWRRCSRPSARARSSR